MKALEFSGVSFAFGAAPVLSDISFQLRAGEMTGVVGPNGSGKTTLVSLASGVLRPRTGGIAVMGRDLSSYSRKDLSRMVAVVPQESLSVFPYTVEETVSMGRYPHLGWGGLMSGADREACLRAMELTGVAAFRSRTLEHLSAGERQRVLLARALAQEPALLLLDEASSFLDIGQELRLFELLDRLRRERDMALLAVSHDLNLVGRFCQRVLMLREGAVLDEGRLAEVYTSGNLSRLYGIDVETGSRPDGGVSVNW